MNYFNKRIGILGGGQLGKMLCEKASDWHLDTWVLDKSSDFPAAQICHHFVKGDFGNAEDVYNFGTNCDVVTIEIESVSIEGIQKLEAEGIPVYPSSKQLAMIKDKGLQNDFFERHQIPSPSFFKVDHPKDIHTLMQKKQWSFPVVNKLRVGGYDGKGVHILKNEKDIQNTFSAPCIIEKCVEIKKELAIIVARNTHGEIKTYDPVEMVFDPEANLVQRLQCKADISIDIEHKMRSLAEKIALELDLKGILAIEFFLDQQGLIFVNELAPRPHNSGHHSIEACYTSQFEQHLRAILGLPLGETSLRSQAVMINVLGADDQHGASKIDGLELVMQMKGVYLHLYGKAETRPKRKMGHLTILDNDLSKAVKKSQHLFQNVKTVATDSSS